VKDDYEESEQDDQDEGRNNMSQQQQTGTGSKGNGNSNGSANGDNRESALALLKQQMRGLEGSIQDQQQQIESQKTKLKLLEADLKAQTKASEDVDKAIEAYKKDWAGLTKRYKELTVCAESRLSELQTELGSEARTIDNKYKAVIDEVEQLEQAIDDLEKKGSLTLEGGLSDPPKSVQEADLYYKNALNEKAAAEAAYAELLNRGKTLKAWLDQADALNKLVEEEEELGHQYVLNKELCDLLKKIEIGLIDPSQYESELVQAWSELSTAQAKSRNTEQALKALQAKLEADKKELGEAKKEQRDRIFESLLTPEPTAP
jgi:chromosome segregation ATPase